jgi:hypothetical protein
MQIWTRRVDVRSDGGRKQLACGPGVSLQNAASASRFVERGDAHPHAQSGLRRVFWTSLDFACLRAAASCFLPPIRCSDLPVVVREDRQRPKMYSNAITRIWPDP